MKEWKYSESYGVLRSKHRLGPKLNFATALVKYYVTLMLTAEIEIVVSVLAELDELVWFYFMDNSSDLCKYAKQLHGDKKYVESVLFYYIAFSTLKKETDLSTFPTLTFKICNGIMESVDSLKQEYLITAGMVECYFIPFFRKCINAVRKKMIYNPRASSLTQAEILLQVVRSYEILRDPWGEEATSEEAVEVLKKAHGKHCAKKYFLYGFFLGYLGRTNLQFNSIKASVEFYTEALAAKKKASDYPSATAKADDIRKAEEDLKNAQKYCRKRLN